ncbi:MAG TPA: DNA mismatch repair protein MutS, partial [Spirochaetia bacterium]|nr:DNA mismatch repair protein MutS [Spirochaetia bacterium]
NLEQGISTFYAELKRMKMIVDAVSAGDPIIYLLDEIFKGTNSQDRILAGKTIIRKLCRSSTLGLVTTHDLELGVLERECPSLVKNYHFSDIIIGDHISFDYKLKPGISQSSNAFALMKLIGIEMERDVGI